MKNSLDIIRLDQPDKSELAENSLQLGPEVLFASIMVMC